MKKVLQPEFVEFIPEALEENKIYISMTYATAVHKCCCGCGREVVTPLSPTGWRIRIDGGYVTLYPSIGNWSFPCQSHYWIRRNEVHWSRRWSRTEIAAGRRYDRRITEQYFDPDAHNDDAEIADAAAAPQESFWQKLKRWFTG